MNEIVVIVEGQTESTFVNHVLAAHFGLLGASIWPIGPGKTGKSYGIKGWESARHDIVNSLKGGKYCTTMFDFYAMPGDWPGRAEAAKLPWDQRGTHVEANMMADITKRMGQSWNPKLFIPYVQVHEFEALAFSDTGVLAEVASSSSGTADVALKPRFDAVLEHATNPEAINDHHDTCPSRRITTLAPGYRKALHGPIVVKRIGLDRLRERCAHFNQWIAKLEQLVPAQL